MRYPGESTAIACVVFDCLLKVPVDTGYFQKAGVTITPRKLDLACTVEFLLSFICTSCFAGAIRASAIPKARNSRRRKISWKSHTAPVAFWLYCNHQARKSGLSSSLRAASMKSGKHWLLSIIVSQGCALQALSYRFLNPTMISHLPASPSRATPHSSPPMYS